VLAREYAAVSRRLTRLFLQSLPFKEALVWLARHLRAVCAAAGDSWWLPGQDHGALVERIRYAAETLRGILPPGQEPAARWAQSLERALGDPRAASAVGSFVGAFLASSFAPVRRSQGVERGPSRLNDEGQRGPT
jgi:hypothetical protein